MRVKKMPLISRIKSWIQEFSPNQKLLLYIILELLLFTVIFEYLVFTWSDNPVQKIVWAPLGEEPFKLLIAFFFCFCVFLFFKISRIRQLDIAKIFIYCFIPLGMISGIYFGISEGPYNNIILHFSTSTIAAILFFLSYKLLLNKRWNPFYKLSIIFPTIILPMFFHSVANQYANIGFADNHCEFEPFVAIARILVTQTNLSHQVLFTHALFLLTYMVIIALIVKFIFLSLITRNITEIDKRGGAKTIIHIIALIPLSIGIGNFLGLIFFFGSDTLFWLSVAILQAFAALLALIMAILIYNLKVVAQAFAEAAERGEPRPPRVGRLNENMSNLRARIFPFVISGGLTIIASIFLLILSKLSLVNSNIVILQNTYVCMGITFLSFSSIYTIYLLMMQIKAVLTLEAR
jgi:hypothetical protein